MKPANPTPAPASAWGRLSARAGCDTYAAHDAVRAADTTSDDNLAPRTPEERELVRNLLRGLRAFERAGLYVNYEWCRVRRSTRTGALVMTVEFDAQRFMDDEQHDD